jgi:hypothetical protein
VASEVTAAATVATAAVAEALMAAVVVGLRVRFRTSGHCKS